MSGLKQSFGGQVLSQPTLFEAGKPRLAYARSYFLDSDAPLDVKSLIGFYKSWRDFKEFLVLQRQVEREDGGVDRETIAVKCAKRGNDVYWNRTEKRLNRILDSKRERSWDPHQTIKETNVLLVTLTYGPKRCSIREAWETIGTDYHKWITNLRNKFGRITCFRTFEAYASGYPHIHCSLIFQDHKFRAFRRYSWKERKVIWRIKEKHEFERAYHSFVDVRAIRTFAGSLHYVTKYLTKSYYEDPALKDLDRSIRQLTLAMCWLFRKKSFAMSKDLLESIRLLCVGEISKRWGQMTLDNLEVTWVFLGVFSAEELGIHDVCWSVKLTNLNFLPSNFIPPKFRPPKAEREEY